MINSLKCFTFLNNRCVKSERGTYPSGIINRRCTQFLHICLFHLIFYKTPLSLLQVGWILFTCNFIKMLKQLCVGFLSLGDVFAGGNFGVCRVAGLCFTWKYYLCPRDLWWLCCGAFLSCNHHLIVEQKKTKLQLKTHAFKIWGLG